MMLHRKKVFFSSCFTTSGTDRIHFSAMQGLYNGPNLGLEIDRYIYIFEE